MPIKVTNIASSSTVVGGTVTITIGAGGVPAGAHIFVCAGDNAVTADHSVADTAGNTYLSAAATTNATIEGIIFRARTGLALSNGNTIVYTLSTGATTASVNAFYATGLANVASEASATAGATSTTPSVTSGVPAGGGDLFVGLVASDTTSTFTQDATNAAWATPPGTVSTTAPVLGGGNVVNTTNSTRKYAPTLGTSGTWVAMIAGFKAQPDVFSFFDVVPQTIVKKVAAGAAIAAIASGLTFVNVPTKLDWHQPWSEPVKDQAYEVSTYDAEFVVPQAASVPEDRWHQSWSGPVRIKQGLHASEQQTLAFVKAAPFAEAVSIDRWLQPISIPPILAKRGLSPQQQQFAAQTLATGPSTGWYLPLSESSVKSKSGLPTAEQQFLAFTKAAPFLETVTEDRWHQPWAEPTRRIDGPYRQQTSAFAPTQIAAAVVTEDRWHQAWSDPVRDQPYEVTAIEADFVVPQASETITEDKWHQAWSMPRTLLKGGLPASEQQYLAFVKASPFPETVSEDRWHQPWSEPVRLSRFSTALQNVAVWFGVQDFFPFAAEGGTITFSRKILYQSEVFPVPIVSTTPAPPMDWASEINQPRPDGFEVVSDNSIFVVPQAPQAVTVDKWFNQQLDPVRFRPALPTSQQQFLAYVGAAPFAETVTESRWHQPWSEPVRVKPGLPAGEQQFLASVPRISEIITVDKWFEWLTEPIRQKLGLPSGEQLASAAPIAPVAETIREDKWHQAWSTPSVLAKISLAAADQQFLAFVKATPFAELVSEDRWHQPWSEPVRQKPGLRTALNPELAYYPKLSPIAGLTGTMAAKETPDTALFVGNVFTAPVSALVSIIENPFVGAYVGLIEKAAISASVSIIETKGP